MKLYILRHGITDFNENGNRHDHENIAMLTEAGKIRAHNLISFLEDKNIDAIYSSPFQRCIDTIEPSASALGLKIITDNRLGEVILGPMQGKSWLEVSNEYNQKLHDINGKKVEGCEHMSEVRKRVAECIKEIYPTNIGKNVIICSHAGTIINMMAVLGKDIINSKDFLPDNKHHDERTFKVVEINNLLMKSL